MNEPRLYYIRFVLKRYFNRFQEKKIELEINIMGPL